MFWLYLYYIIYTVLFMFMSNKTLFITGGTSGMAKAVVLQAAKKELSKWQMIERRGTPDEIANVILFLLLEKASFMTGSLVTADGWYTSS